MNHVEISNPDLTKQETTELTADADAGSSVELSVKSNQGYSADELILVKIQGSDKCEKCKISSVSGNDKITVATLKYDHLAGEEIRKTPYDEVVLYYSSEEDGTYTAIGTWTDINFDDYVTYIDHAAGTSSTWYKAEYRHSVSHRTSGKSDAFQVTSDVHYCTLNEVYEEAGMVGNRYIAPERVFRLRAGAESEAKGTIAAKYNLPLSEVPDVVAEAVKLMAAGKLLFQEFGTDAAGTQRDGAAKIKEGRSMLKDIRNGKIALLDSDDSELEQKDTGTIEGLPDNSTDEDVVFEIDQEF